MGGRRSRAAATLLLVSALLSGCAGTRATVEPSPAALGPAGLGAGPATVSAAPSTTAAASPTASPTSVTPTTASPTVADRAAVLVGRMSLSERAGAVLMTAQTVGGLASAATLARRYHLAGVMVRGRSAAGTAAVHRALAAVRDAASSGLPLLVSTDQEGGTVQVLRGTGFAVIPSAVVQGTRSTAALRKDAAAWGRALVAAGVDLDLAPVADVPCASTLHDNPPVADLRRQYGSDPVAAGRHVAAFVAGMHDARVAPTVKHFPGLGCVRANTDTTAHVVDTVTTADSPRIAAFRAGIAGGARFVMVSSASYARIDAGVPALFSRRIVGGLLRDRLGFGGVVMSDDTGAARALAAWTPGQRATKFIAAGGDLLLDVVPAHVPALHAALVDRAHRDPAFAARLADAARHVVAERLRLRRSG